jgi:hypothetical protein
VFSFRLSMSGSSINLNYYRGSAFAPRSVVAVGAAAADFESKHPAGAIRRTSRAAHKDCLPPEQQGRRTVAGQAELLDVPAEAERLRLLEEELLRLLQDERLRLGKHEVLAVRLDDEILPLLDDDLLWLLPDDGRVRAEERLPDRHAVAGLGVARKERRNRQDEKQNEQNRLH